MKSYKSGPPQFQTLRCEVYVNSYIWRDEQAIESLKKKNGLATLEFGGGISESAPSSFTREKAGGFSFWSHILKIVSVTHRELAGEEAGEGPSDSAEGQNRAEKRVQGFHPTPHTPQITMATEDREVVYGRF